MPISQNCNPALLNDSANSWIYKLKVARRRKTDFVLFLCHEGEALTISF